MRFTRPLITIVAVRRKARCNKVAGSVKRCHNIIAHARLPRRDNGSQNSAEQSYSGRRISHSGRRIYGRAVGIGTGIKNDAVCAEICDRVNSRTVDHRAVDAVTRHLPHDQPGIFPVQCIPVETELFKPCGSSAGDKHIGLGKHAVHQLNTGGILQIQGHTFLSAVKYIMDRVFLGRDRHTHRPTVIAAKITYGRSFDSDNTGAHISQKARRCRCGPIACHLDHKYTFKRFSHWQYLLIFLLKTPCPEQIGHGAPEAYHAAVLSIV